MAQRKKKTATQKAVQELSKTKSGRILLIVVALILIAGAIFGYWYYKRKTQEAEVMAFPDVSEQDISVHFLELGNKYAGDCIYIKTADSDILIDCGSRPASVQTIKTYLEHYVTDGTIEYTIVTHAHQDHYACFAGNSKNKSIFEYFDFEVVIDFAGTENNKTEQRMYQNYQAALASEVESGATHYTALQCVNESDGASDEYSIGAGYTMKILNSYYYEHPDTSNENNNSVCCLISNGTKNYLFTGDLESEGEEKLLTLNTLPEVDLFKAGHHGSKTSSSSALLSVIKPKTIVVCCCAGSPEYAKSNPTPNNVFPTQVFINNVAPHTDEIYVTSLYVEKSKSFTHFNGNVVYMAKGTTYVVACSHSSVKLKNSEWFKKNRTWPA